MTLLGSLDDIPRGEGRTYEVRGTRIAVFRTRSDEIFATQAACPHKAGPLADGLVGGQTLICPLHSWKFDLKTGKALLGDCGLVVYPASLDESGRILVAI